MEEKKLQEEPVQWFAMRATYRSEMDTKDKLELAGITSFLPLTIQEKRIGGRKKRVWAPAVSSLIFVYGQKSRIQAFKDRNPRLQYLCAPTLAGIRTPIIVPDDQMTAFIRLFEGGTYELTDDLSIVNNIKPGNKVRITEGPFEGLVGTFQRIKGHRNKVFVIRIENVACISTTMVSPDMVEMVDEK